MTIFAWMPGGGPLGDLSPIFALIGLVLGARFILKVVRWVNRRDDPVYENGRRPAGPSLSRQFGLWVRRCFVRSGSAN